jgi:hypothetical protein
MADRRPRPRRTSAHRIRVIAAELASAGLAAGVLQTRDVLDVTASLREPGRKDVEVIVDEDLYVEVGYWNQPDATAAQATSVILRVLAAITGPL